MPQDVVVTETFGCMGGSVCLDFINTVSWPTFDHERFLHYDDVIRWALAGEVLGTANRARLSRLAAGKPRSAERELKKLLALRSLLHRAFAAIAAGKRIRPRDLRAFNAGLAAALRDSALVPRRGELRWSHEAGAVDLAFLRRRVIWDAARLLTSGRLSILRRCASPTCGWLFLDESRRGNRRWCSMADCGSRAKAKRYYDRKKRLLSGRSGDRPRQRHRPQRRGRPSSSR